MNSLLAWSGASQTSLERTEHDAIEITSCGASVDNMSAKVDTSRHQGKLVTEGFQESGCHVSCTSSNEELHTNQQIPKRSSKVSSTESLTSSSLTTKPTGPHLPKEDVNDSPEIDHTAVNSCFVHLGETGVLRPRSAEQSSQLIVANTNNAERIRLKEQIHIKQTARIDYCLRTCNNARPNILKSKTRLTDFSARFASLGLGRSENTEKKLSSPVYTPWKQKENFRDNKRSIIQRMNLLKQQQQPSLHRKRETRYLLSPRKQ